MNSSIRAVRFGAAAATAFLAGCGGGIQPPISQLPATPQAAHRAPFMGKGLKQRDLLYVTNSNGTVNVYRYWQETLVGVLTNFGEPMGECADSAGNVYITDFQKQKLFEYAHGATKPVRTIDDSPYDPNGCAVDPSTGNLAVANFDKGSYTAGNIAVYKHGSGTPILYKGRDDDHFTNCGYSDRGDLLTTSEYGYYSYDYYTEFYYLPKHGVNLIAMDLPDPYDSSGWGYVPGVAWDGKYWAVENYGELYTFAINIKAKFENRTQLLGTYGRPGPFAFYRKSSTSPATQVVAGSSDYNGKYAVDYWPYPAGGSPIHDIVKDLDGPFGVAISMGQ